MTKIVTLTVSNLDSTAGWQVTETNRSKVGDAMPGTSKPAAPPLEGKVTATEPNDVGTALRKAFRATLEEEIPAEMLDLLKRLD